MPPVLESGDGPPLTGTDVTLTLPPMAVTGSDCGRAGRFHAPEDVCL